MASVKFVLSLLLMRVADSVLSKTRTQKIPQAPGASAFGTAPIAATQFLIISSPQEKKIVWTTLQNMESADGRAFALVDSGLSEPKGLAFDHERGHLFVADSAAKKIFRYTVVIDVSAERPVLSTTGIRLTIMQDHPVEWVTVDKDGNLFYTAPDTNNINKIEKDVMTRLNKGEFAPSALQIVSQKTLQAQELAKQTKEAKEKKEMKKNGTSSLPVDPPDPEPKILRIYESSVNPHVASPASIWAEGNDLYWVNQKDGKKAGTVVKGEVHPVPKFGDKGPEPFPADAITSLFDGAYGLAKSDKMMLFSRDGDKPKSGAVTGILTGTDIAIDFITTLVKPRGIVWDQDQTMYVADEQGGSVWSFPIGRMMKEVPLTRAVTMKGAYGLMILSSDDKAFEQNKVEGSSQAENQALQTQAALYKENQGSIATAAEYSSAGRAHLQFILATILVCMRLVCL